MPKSPGSLAAAAIALAGTAPAFAAILGPHAAACHGHAPAMLVRITGLKARTGTVRVQSYGGDPAQWFNKGSYLERVEVRPPETGPLEVCLPVPQPGTYAVSVRHDLSGNGRTDLSDGGGMSGNPNVSLMDVVLKRRPSPEEVAVQVKGVTTVPVTLNYVHGASVGPIAGAVR